VTLPGEFHEKFKREISTWSKFLTHTSLPEVKDCFSLQCFANVTDINHLADADVTIPENE
jgi:hypothetical protein